MTGDDGCVLGSLLRHDDDLTTDGNLTRPKELLYEKPFDHYLNSPRTSA
jgi:hypothetical protein